MHVALQLAAALHLRVLLTGRPLLPLLPLLLPSTSRTRAAALARRTQPRGSSSRSSWVRPRARPQHVHHTLATIALAHSTQHTAHIGHQRTKVGPGRNTPHDKESSIRDKHKLASGAVAATAANAWTCRVPCHLSHQQRTSNSGTHRQPSTRDAISNREQHGRHTSSAQKVRLGGSTVMLAVLTQSLLDSTSHTEM